MLDLRAAGRTRRECAQILGLSEHTIHMHLANAYSKLGVSSLIDALRVLGRLT